MYVKRHVVSITTDASGDATVYTEALTGRILGIRLAASTLDATVDTTITAEATGESILTLTNVNAVGSYYPRVGTHDTAGAAALYAAGGTAVRDCIALADDRVKFVVAQGGNAKTATFHVIVG